MRNNKGFSLLEIIISVAALAVISMFIIEMFYASSRLNQRAKDADIAMSRAVSAVERLLGHDSLTDYLAVVDLQPDKTALWPTDDMGEWLSASLYQHYDPSWNAMDEENARFILTMNIKADDSLRGLYYIGAEVTELSPGGDNRVLASLQTKKYFPVVSGG